MSLREAYSLAYTAQCRLNRESSRSNRSLRFVVGHLMHYESLRLRINDMEQSLTRPTSTVTFSSDNEHIEHKLQYKPSTTTTGRHSPPPSAPEPYLDDDTDSDHVSDYSYDDEEDDDDFYGDNDDAQYDDALALSRFPSGSARAVSISTSSSSSNVHPALRRGSIPPELVEHNDDDDTSSDSDSDYEPTTPEELPSSNVRSKTVASEQAERAAADLAEVYRTCMFLAGRARGSACGAEWGSENASRTMGEVEVA